MTNQYLSYWVASTVKDFFEEEHHLLDHAASEQYGRLRKGDGVWIVTCEDGGLLILLGYISVDLVTDQATAAKRLGKQADDLWSAKYHILPEPGDAEPARVVEIPDLAAQLRFQSDRDRLSVIDGRVDAKQLQSLRRLTPASVELLRRRWYEDADYAEALERVRELREGGGGGFGAAEMNRVVEERAVQAATARMTNAGWTVQSVETDRVGYDLLCTRNGKKRHVEVKGVQGEVATFIITESEFLRAKEDPLFWLCVVTSALNKSAKVREFAGRALIEQYEFKALAYRAIPTRQLTRPPASGHKGRKLSTEST